MFIQGWEVCSESSMNPSIDLCLFYKWDLQGKIDDIGGFSYLREEDQASLSESLKSFSEEVV